MDLTKANLKSDMSQPKEWTFMPVGRERGFFLCLGGTKVYQFGGAVWSEVQEQIELMNNTLVYADLVDEIEEVGSKQSISTGFHIIDALVLGKPRSSYLLVRSLPGFHPINWISIHWFYFAGGKDIRELPYNERFDLITKYARSINKNSRDDLAAIRAKPHYELKTLHRFMER